MKRLLIALMLLLAASTTVNAADPFSSWTVPHKGVLETAQFWTHHQQQCGKPKGAAKWGGSTVSQRFARCQIHATFGMTHPGASPTPTASAVPPLPTATAPTATSTPIATSAPPTATPGAQTPAQYVLNLLNADRATYGIAPLTLEPTLSQCALAHSQRMASEGQLSHDGFPSPDVCVPFTRAGQNVGMGSGQTLEAELTWLDSSMMAEPHSPGCSGNHACNIISAGFARVGIGVYVYGSIMWLTETFTN